MKSILILNDHPSYAVCAAEFALQIAQQHRMHLIVGTEMVKVRTSEPAVALMSGMPGDPEDDDQLRKTLVDHLSLLSRNHNGFNPDIRELDISGLDADELNHIIMKNEIWVIIKGTAATLPDKATGSNGLNLQALVNKVLIPVFLIPQHWQRKTITNISYITDLRYCRKDVISYLMNFFQPFKTNVHITHLCIPGIPDMTPVYASAFFEEVAGNWTEDKRLFLHYIKNTDVTKLADVMINTMENDALVLINHSPHYHQLIDENLNVTQAELLNALLILFPN